MTNDAKDYVMKTKSKIVLLLAGAAMSASATVAYAQNGGGNQQPAPGMQNCEQGTPGQGPCGEGMGQQGMGQQGMGQPGMGPQAMGERGMAPRDSDFRGGRHGKWGGQMASNEGGRHGPGMMGQRGHGFGGKRGQGPNFELMFQKADKDNSGTVTLEEFTAAMPMQWADADADGDGSITAQELADQMQRQMLLRRAEMMIKRFDTDNDGKVSTAEIEKARQDRFARLDVDDSGAIEQDEMQLRQGGDRDGRGGHGQFHQKGGYYGRN